MCENTATYAFRGYCLFCLFDKTTQWDDDGSVEEILNGVAIKALEVGIRHAKTGEEIYTNKSKKRVVNALYKLYSYGFVIGETTKSC